MVPGEAEARGAAELWGVNGRTNKGTNTDLAGGWSCFHRAVEEVTFSSDKVSQQPAVQGAPRERLYNPGLCCSLSWRGQVLVPTLVPQPEMRTEKSIAGPFPGLPSLTGRHSFSLQNCLLHYTWILPTSHILGPGWDITVMNQRCSQARQ